MMNKNDLHIGMKVIFGTPNGQKTLGEIVKINRVRAKVKQLEARGMKRAYPVGTVWSVPFNMMWPYESHGIQPDEPILSVDRDWQVGDRVQFTARGLTITGTVKRVNRKTVSVTPDNPDFPGRYWRVSPHLLRAA